MRQLLIHLGSLQWRITLTYIFLVMLPLGWLYFFELGEPRGGHTGLLAALFFFLCFSTGLVYVWSGQLARVLRELTHVIGSLDEGKSVRFYGIDGRDEIGQLAQAVTRVAENMQNRIHELSQEKSKFETVLGSMVEGVVSFDHLGRILLINRAAENMLLVNAAIAKGRLLVEVIRNRELDAVLAASLHTGEAGKRELQLWPNQPQTYRVQVVPVWSEQRRLLGAVMVIDDVTEVRRLEQMRTEFVANVSHELRTPLTSIKGFVETLLDGAVEEPKVARRFLTIIAEETQRLQRLIEDILHLSKIESQRVPTLNGESQLEPEVNRVRNLLEPMAKEKNIELNVDIETGLPLLPVSPDHLKQVLMNLVENAIKYTQPGGKVFLSASSTKNGVLIEVRDTGIGIPKESLLRIFERFYRVDKARSREMGGTGLGLAIVKHIVERSGGRVNVTSQVGLGTTFSVLFPFAGT